MIGVGAVSIIVVTLFSYMVKRKFSSGKAKELGEPNALPPEIEIDSESPNDFATEIYQQQSYNYFDPRIASGETEIMSNVRRKLVTILPTPLNQVEESLSEDARRHIALHLSIKIYVLGCQPRKVNICVQSNMLLQFHLH